MWEKHSLAQIFNNAASTSFQTEDKREVDFSEKAHHPSHTQQCAEVTHFRLRSFTLFPRNVKNKTNIICSANFPVFFFQCITLTITAVDVRFRARLAPAPLTDHHEAGLIVERRPVGVDERLLQLLHVYEAAAVGVNTLEPLVGLWVHTWGDVTCNWMEPKINRSHGFISRHPTSEKGRKAHLAFRKNSSFN